MNPFAKALLAVAWHAWDAHDAWRHDPRSIRKVGAYVGLIWSVSLTAAMVWELSRPQYIEVRRGG